MNRRKLIVLWALSLAGVSHAAPASLTVSVPSDLFAGLVSTATVTVNTGSGVFGAADFVITYDTAGISITNVSAADSAFEGTTYVDSSVVGRIHILAMNGASLTSPTGSVDLATLTFIPTHSGAGVLNAQVNLVIDTEPAAYTPVTVSPGHFIARADTTPPRTELLAGGVILSSSPVSVSSSTVFALSAMDVIVDYVTPVAGVRETWLKMDSGVYELTSGSFTVPVGTHTLSFYSVDNAGNQEAVQERVVILVNAAPPAVDVTPPASTLVVDQPMRRLNSGITQVTANTPLSISAIDPLREGFASGVQDSWVAIDDAAFQPANGTFFLNTVRNGLHRLQYYSRDNASNRETVHVASVMVLPRTSGFHSMGAAAPADFVARETFVFPNPARAGVAPTIHAEVGIADEVCIRIFDAAGRQVHEATLSGAPTLMSSGEYAYEYVWDAPVPSGVYFYAIRAKKAGTDDIKVKGKFAVVR